MNRTVLFIVDLKVSPSAKYYIDWLKCEGKTVHHCNTPQDGADYVEAHKDEIACIVLDTLFPWQKFLPEMLGNKKAVSFNEYLNEYFRLSFLFGFVIKQLTPNIPMIFIDNFKKKPSDLVREMDDVPVYQQLDCDPFQLEKFIDERIAVPA